MPKKGFSSLSYNQKLIIVIPSIVAVLAAIIGSHDWFQRQAAKSTEITPLPIDISTTSAISSEKLEFISTNDSSSLNPNLQWEAGSSKLNLYSFDGNTINLTAGPHTWPNFPAIYYKQPVTGNFDVQVKVDFQPEASILDSAQMAGLLVRPINARLVQGNPGFPKDWAVVGKLIADAGSLVGCRGSWPDYSSNIVYIKLERDADSWRCAYSENGDNWIWFNANVDNVLLRDKPLIISLFAYSDTDKAITVKFADWVIHRNQ